MITLIVCIMVMVLLVKLIGFTIKASWFILSHVLKAVLVLLGPVLVILMLVSGSILGGLVLAAFAVWAICRSLSPV